jgi:hypothetical protein
MKKFVLPYHATGYFSKAVVDYLDGTPTMQPYYKYRPSDNSFTGIIEDRKLFSHRKTLVAALTKQHESLSYKNSLNQVTAHIAALGNEILTPLPLHISPIFFLAPCIWFIRSSPPLIFQSNSIYSFRRSVSFLCTGWVVKITTKRS